MAFSLQGFKAFSVRCDGATRQHGKQVVLMKIIAANTDTALDISSDTAGSLGTFWTDATGDSTYGDLATSALADIRTIVSNIAQLVGVSVPCGYLRVASGASGDQYTQTVTGNLPSIAYVSGSAPTSQIVEISWVMKDGIEPIIRDYGNAF